MERGKIWETESKVGKIEKELQEGLLSKVQGEEKKKWSNAPRDPVLCWNDALHESTHSRVCLPGVSPWAA